MAVTTLKITKYEKYRLSRLIYVKEIVSADYVQGNLAPSPHTHADAWELLCCLSGNMTIEYGQQTLTLYENQAFCVPPGINHFVTLSKDGENAGFVVSFTCSDEPIKLLRNQTLEILPLQNQIIENIVREMMDAFTRSNPGLRIYHFEPNPEAPLGAEQMILTYLEQLLIIFLRSVTMHKGVVITGTRFEEAMGNYQIDSVQRYIREHLQDPLSVDTLAREFHYSRTRLSVLFKEGTGQTLNEYITAERIAKAKKLLSDGNLSVTQISRAVGYASPQYFSRRFMQMVGCAPSNYVQLSSEK